MREARPKSESSAEDDGRDAAKGKREAMKKAYAERRRDLDGAGGGGDRPRGHAGARREERRDAHRDRAVGNRPVQLARPRRQVGRHRADRAVDGGAIRQTRAAPPRRLARAGGGDDAHACLSSRSSRSSGTRCTNPVRDSSQVSSDTAQFRVACAIRFAPPATTPQDLIALAEAVEEHPAIANLSVGNQLAKLSTVAIGRLIDAQERTPSLLHLHLGQLRDPTQITRLEMVSVANIEKARLAKLSQSSRRLARRRRRLAAALAVLRPRAAQIGANRRLGARGAADPRASTLRRSSTRWDCPGRRAAVARRRQHVRDDGQCGGCARMPRSGSS